MKKVFNAIFLALFKTGHFLLFHAMRLGRNVAHFFFNAFATIALFGSILCFFDTFLKYGYGDTTGWILAGVSFALSLLPWFYDKALIYIIPRGKEVYI